MKVSLNWLNEYFNTNLDRNELERRFNLHSQEVAGVYPLTDIEGLVVGHVISLNKHDDADKLSVCLVDIGTETLQIICGAPNVRQNQKVIVAQSGVVLPGNFKLKKTKIRGVESNGMICSLLELGVQEFDSDEKGIYVLGDDAVVGSDPLEYLSLNDYILDLDLNPNRSDLLSVRGIAYDTACLFDIDFKMLEPNVDRETDENPINIFTQTKNSSVYYGQVLKNVKITKSPFWMRARLLSSGIRPINNVVDITNYVMLEYGQPLHAFDYDKITTNKILVREAKKGESIITLDGETRVLIETDLVITDGVNPIALAGVMGGLETEIVNNTKNILLESAVFNPISVRKTANRLNLKSESSTRFEKGIDSNKTLEALNRACELLIKYANATVIGKPSYYNNTSNKTNVVEISLAKLNQVTGNDFTEEVVEDIIDRLRFNYKFKNGIFFVTIPSRRPMDSYQDLVEEIVRIYGYDKIPNTLPQTPTQGYLNSNQKTRRLIRNFFVDRGFYETRTYSLVSKKTAVKFDMVEEEPILILNPLTKEREALRHSLLPSLLNVLVYNKARKIDDIFLFEIGNTYYKEGQIEKLALLLHGKKDYSSWQKHNGIIDFYYAKGLVESLFNSLRLSNYSFEVSPIDIPNLHPGISANILIDNINVGFIGKLHPEEEHLLGVDDVFLCELNLDEIKRLENDLKFSFNEISKYPSVKRDIAILVDINTSAQTIVNLIKNTGRKLLKSINIFDVYYDSNNPEKKSVAVSLEYQSETKTLETEEVDLAIRKVLDSLEKELGAEQRK